MHQLAESKNTIVNFIKILFVSPELLYQYKKKFQTFIQIFQT